MLVKCKISVQYHTKVSCTFNGFQLFPQKREAKVIYLGSYLSAAKCDKFVLSGLSKGWLRKHEFRIVNKTRQDIYYHNITSTIVWHVVSKKTLVEACQINSITNQILNYNK